jgi:1-acyl-sn-glycerol-3-phosphate acyltransferase
MTDTTPSVDAAPAATSAPTKSTDAAKVIDTAGGQAYVYRGEGSGFRQVLAWNVGKWISRVLATLLFGLQTRGIKNIPRTGPVLLVTNHQSFLDPWLIGVPVPRQVHYMARDTLFKGGFLGFLLELLNAFPIKRGRADLTAIRLATDRLQDGYMVNLFPEGTRTEDGTIGPIAPGVSLILRRCKVPVTVVPLVFDGALEAWGRQRKLPRVWPVRLQVGAPLSGETLKALPADELGQLLREKLVGLQELMGSPHAAASRARLQREHE